MIITSQGEELILDKERAIYFPKNKLLAISDLHLGKSAHFRKFGLPVPSTLAQNDLQRLSLLLKTYQPKSLLINGDMFHDSLNSDIDNFYLWRKDYKELDLLLVKGNHDRLTATDYASMDIQVYAPSYCLGPFCFIHDAPKHKEEELYPITGHIHPGITITGKAKQRLKFPCFFFGKSYAIMPAFSCFTGLFNIKPVSGEKVFAITPQQVIEV